MHFIGVIITSKSDANYDSIIYLTGVVNYFNDYEANQSESYISHSKVVTMT